RTRLAAVEVPLRVVSLSSRTVTAPAEVNVSVPKFIVSDVAAPRVIVVPARLAFPVTERLALLASLSAPVEARTRLAAVEVPLRVVSLSSLTVTAPAEVNVSVPKFIVSDVAAPRVIVVPARLAFPVTERLALLASLSAPVEARTRLAAVEVPL